jgi:hypothetical protein
VLARSRPARRRPSRRRQCFGRIAGQHFHSNAFFRHAFLIGTVSLSSVEFFSHLASLSRLSERSSLVQCRRRLEQKGTCGRFPSPVMSSGRVHPFRRQFELLHYFSSIVRSASSRPSSQVTHSLYPGRSYCHLGLCLRRSVSVLPDGHKATVRRIRKELCVGRRRRSLRACPPSVRFVGRRDSRERV